MNPHQLDRFGLLALICCCFSVCTTRPITQKPIADAPTMATYEATPDKVDSLFLQISTVEAQGESLATRLSTAISKYTSAKGEKKPDRGLYYQRELHIFECPDTIQN